MDFGICQTSTLVHMPTFIYLDLCYATTLSTEGFQLI
jgi:hypothetical protein